MGTRTNRLAASSPRILDEMVETQTGMDVEMVLGLLRNLGWLHRLRDRNKVQGALPATLPNQSPLRHECGKAVL